MFTLARMMTKPSAIPEINKEQLVLKGRNVPSANKKKMKFLGMSKDVCNICKLS